MLLIPPAFISIVTAWIVELALFDYYKINLKLKEAKHCEKIYSALFKVIEILGPITNFISCLILTMVIALVLNMTRQVQMGASIVAAKTKINTFVTGSHIGVTIAFTIT
jgi:hypothetical protein